MELAAFPGSADKIEQCCNRATHALLKSGAVLAACENSH